MEIVWLGHSCFRIRSREGTVVTDPCDKKTGYAIGKVSADIVTVSHDHPGHSNVAAVSNHPRIIRGPGEFEVSGISIIGIETFHDAKRGAERGKNTAYVFELEDLRVCHLGDLGHLPTEEQVEELSGIDILLIPVGGGSTIDAGVAMQTVNLLEPALVIPMHYRTEVSTDPDLAPVDRFLKEMGASDAERTPRLTITRSGLPSETQVVYLEYRR